MSSAERELLSRLLKQSILTLCRETVSFNSEMEVDGIICISVEDSSQPIVVKIHEQMRSHNAKTYRDVKSVRKRKSNVFSNDLSMVDNSPLSDGTQDVGINLNDVSMEESRHTSSLLAEALNASYPGDINAEKHKMLKIDTNENIDDKDERTKPCSSPDMCEINDATLVRALIHTNSTAMSHPQGLLCKRCFAVLPDISSLDQHNLKEHALFTCKICFKGFTARNNLKRHFRLHTGVRPYKCSICQQGFTRKDDLKAHVLRHSYTKPFRCSICGKGYTDRSCVRTHMAKEHRTRLLHVCPQCGEGFDDPVLYAKHKKAHPEFKSFRCGICSFIGISGLDITKHSLTHSSKTYTCDPCEKQYNDPYEYSAHLKTHKMDDTFMAFVCCFCSTVLPTYEQFIRHEFEHAQMKTQFGSNAFRQVSDFSPSNEREEENPDVAEPGSDDGAEPEEDDGSISKQYWCAECQVGFSCEDSFHVHIFTAHEGDSTESANAFQPPMIELKKGGIQLANDLNLTPSHNSTLSDNVPMVDLSMTKVPQLLPYERKAIIFPARNDHVEADALCRGVNGSQNITIKKEVPDPDEGDNGNAEGFASDYSPRSDSPPIDGKDNDNLLERVHIRSPGFERVVTPDIPYKSQTQFSCQVCHELFLDFSTFESHSSSLHRRFVCEYCGKIFTAKPNRERHVRYHTGEKPYKCDLCEQTFFRGDDLKYHRTTRHSGVKPFKCKSCGMTFAWPKELDRHIRTRCPKVN